MKIGLGWLLHITLDDSITVVIYIYACLYNNPIKISTYINEAEEGGPVEVIKIFCTKKPSPE